MCYNTHCQGTSPPGEGATGTRRVGLPRRFQPPLAPCRGCGASTTARDNKMTTRNRTRSAPRRKPRGRNPSGCSDAGGGTRTPTPLSRRVLPWPQRRHKTNIARGSDRPRDARQLERHRSRLPEATMRLRRYRPAAVLLLALHLHACVTHRPVTTDPAEFLRSERPGRVRVTKTDGTTVAVREPVVSGDSIFGVETYSDISNISGQPREVTRTREVPVMPLNELSQLEVVSVSGWRTTGLILGITAVGLIGLLVWVSSQFDELRANVR